VGLDALRGVLVARAIVDSRPVPMLIRPRLELTQR
jgi:hypothetical protein